MSDLKKQFEIDIKTVADPSGVQDTEAALQDLGTATEEVGEKAEKTEETSEKLKEGFKKIGEEAGNLHGARHIVEALTLSMQGGQDAVSGLALGTRVLGEAFEGLIPGLGPVILALSTIGFLASEAFTKTSEKSEKGDVKDESQTLKDEIASCKTATDGLIDDSTKKLQAFLDVQNKITQSYKDQNDALASQFAQVNALNDLNKKIRTDALQYQEDVELSKLKPDDEAGKKAIEEKYARFGKKTDQKEEKDTLDQQEIQGQERLGQLKGENAEASNNQRADQLKLDALTQAKAAADKQAQWAEIKPDEHGDYSSTTGDLQKQKAEMEERRKADIDTYNSLDNTPDEQDQDEKDVARDEIELKAIQIKIDAATAAAKADGEYAKQAPDLTKAIQERIETIKANSLEERKILDAQQQIYLKREDLSIRSVDQTVKNKTEDKDDAAAKDKERYEANRKDAEALADQLDKQNEEQARQKEAQEKAAPKNPNAKAPTPAPPQTPVKTQKEQLDELLLGLSPAEQQQVLDKYIQAHASQAQTPEAKDASATALKEQNQQTSTDKSTDNQQSIQDAASQVAEAQRVLEKDPNQGNKKIEQELLNKAIERLKALNSTPSDIGTIAQAFVDAHEVVVNKVMSLDSKFAGLAEKIKDLTAQIKMNAASARNTNSI